MKKTLVAILYASILGSGCSKSQIELGYEESKLLRENILAEPGSRIDLSKIANKNVVGICLIEYVADLNFIEKATGGIFRKQEVYSPPGDDHVVLAFWSSDGDKRQVVFKSEEMAFDNESLRIKSNNFCFKSDLLIVKHDSRFKNLVTVVSFEGKN